MRILYVARHHMGNEQAIAFALEALGHQIVCLNENNGNSALRLQRDADCVLFNKWMQVSTISGLSIPRFFWYFDLVDSDDTRFVLINQDRRIHWMNAITPLVNAGFMTDGDWADKYGNGKLIHLTQGVDERHVGYGTSRPGLPPIIFTGSINHSILRLQHIQALEKRYGDKFAVIGNPDRRIYGRDLSDLFASTKIAIAPLGLVTDRYWSNRVFMTLGLGGFLLHPYSEGLKEFYEFGKELVVYRTEEECFDLIDYYLQHDEERESIRRAGHERTIRDHTYRHRCKVLVDHMQSFIMPRKRKFIPLK